jgi:hypothetical protein
MLRIGAIHKLQIIRQNLIYGPRKYLKAEKGHVIPTIFDLDFVGQWIPTLLLLLLLRLLI